MLLRLNPAFDAMRNKLVQNTTGIVAYGLPSPNGNRQFSRNYVVPANPKTLAQIQSRATFTAISTAWSALSDSVVAAWNARAATVHLTDALGRAYNPSGKAWYQSVNTYRILQGNAISSTAPTGAKPGNWSLDDQGVTGANLSMTLVSDSGAAIVDDTWGFVRLTPPLPGTNAQAKATDLRIPSTTTSDAFVDLTGGSPATFTIPTATVLAAMGFTPANTQRLGFSVVVLNTHFEPGSVTFQRSRILA
jgi:hypothetical protein